MVIKHTFAVGRPQQTLVKYIFLPPETHQVRIPPQQGFAIEIQDQCLRVCFCPSRGGTYQTSIVIYDQEHTPLASYYLQGTCQYPLKRWGLLACGIVLLGLCWWGYSSSNQRQYDLALAQLDTLRLGSTVEYIDKTALQVIFQRCGFNLSIEPYPKTLPLDSLITLLQLRRIDGIITETQQQQLPTENITWSKPYTLNEKSDGLKLGLWHTETNKKNLANFSAHIVIR